MAPPPGEVRNISNVKQFDRSYFQFYKIVRPQLSPLHPRIDYLPDEELDLLREKVVQCSYKGCEELAIFKCDPEKSFLRDINFQKVWEGCGNPVCEKHVVKLYNWGRLERLSKQLLPTLFYGFERFRPPAPGPGCCDACFKTCKCKGSKCCDCSAGPNRAVHTPAVKRVTLFDFIGDMNKQV